MKMSLKNNQKAPLILYDANKTIPAGTKIFQKQVRSLKEDTTREVTSSTVTDVKKGNKNPQQLVIRVSLKNRVLKKT